MTKRTSHSYYVVMEDFGRRGMEATVTPETTRRAVVEFVKNGNYRDVVFIHHIDGGLVEDVTSAIFDEAEVLARAEYSDARNVGMDAQAARFDHARDLRKHAAV